MPQVKGAPTPPDEDDAVTELQEKVLLLLEAADMPETVCDRIMAIIATAEADKIDGHGPFTTDEA